MRKYHTNLSDPGFDLLRNHVHPTKTDTCVEPS